MKQTHEFKRSISTEFLLSAKPSVHTEEDEEISGVFQERRGGHTLLQQPGGSTNNMSLSAAVSEFLKSVHKRKDSARH